LKIQIGQLQKTVEGQKAAHESLRNQLAEVYKEKQRESQQQQNYNYVPQTRDNIEERPKSYSHQVNKKEPEPEKIPMTSRWAKPVSEITNPAAPSSTSTPRPDGYGYKSSFTRNPNKETCMMEKYCSNSIGQILNWGQ